MEEVVNQPVVPQTQPPVNSPKVPRSIVIGGVVVFMLLIGMGGYILGTKRSTNSKNAQLAQNYPTEQPLPTKVKPPHTKKKDTVTVPNNWATFTGNTYSIKYPPAWIAKADPDSAGAELLYDPNSLESRANNGGGTVSTPREYVRIVTVPSTESAKKYADKMTTDNPAYTGVDAQRRKITVNGMKAEIYKEEGEASMGYDVVIADGKQVTILTIPDSNPDSDPIINQMLSTFKLQ